MSTLTSLVKSGKRKIIQAVAGQPTAEREQDGVKARRTSRETPQIALGRPDQGLSHDATRPQYDALNPYGQSTLGRPDQGLSHDATRPQQESGATTNP